MNSTGSLSQAVDISVVIPTLNGATGYLRDVLDALRQQTDTDNISWEVLVVDNNSTDNTAKLVKEYQKDWSNRYPLRYASETKQGASRARQKGVDKARGHLIALIDDDNVIAHNWISEAYNFSLDHSAAGAWGGQIGGECEVKLPKNFNRIACLLAIVDRGPKAYRYEPCKVLPPTAGLVVRQNAWCETVPRQTVLNYQRSANHDSFIGRSEDMEILRYMQKGGWEIWHNPRMQMVHIIPNCRLEKEYLVKICHFAGISKFPVRMLSFRRWQKPLALAVYTGNDIRKLLFHMVKYRKSIRSDTIAFCELRLYFGSIIGPLYFLKKKLAKIVGQPANRSTF